MKAGYSLTAEVLCHRLSSWWKLWQSTAVTDHLPPTDHRGNSGSVFVLMHKSPKQPVDYLPRSLPYKWASSLSLVMPLPLEQRFDSSPAHPLPALGPTEPLVNTLKTPERNCSSFLSPTANCPWTERREMHLYGVWWKEGRDVNS